MANDLSPGRGLASQASSAPRTIGMLNVSFASVMLLCGVCSGFSVLMQFTMAPFSNAYQQSMQDALQAQAKQDLAKKIDAVKASEAAATDPAEKTRLAAERQSLEQQQPVAVQLPDMTSLYRDPRLLTYMAGDFVSGALLNALMLISGIGLIASRKWARKLAIWVAGIKIARLVLVYGYAIGIVVPLFAAKMGEMVEKMISSMPARPGGQPPPAQLGQTMAMFYGVSMSAGAVLMIIGGAIYPIIVLWVLTRPKVKAACGELPTESPVGSP